MLSPRSPWRSSALSPTDHSAAPLTFSLQLPFILLGANTTDTSESSSNNGPPTNDTLTRIHGALESLGNGVRFTIWNPTAFGKHGSKPEPLRNEADREEWKSEVKTRKKAWQNEEKRRWTQLSQRGKWVLRVPPTTEEDVANACGLIGPWKRGDALLPDDEVKAAGPQVWSFPFMLQRFGVAYHSVERFEREVQSIFWVLGGLDGSRNEEGTTFKVIIGERCWPCVEFSPPHDGLHMAGSSILSPRPGLLSPHTVSGGGIESRLSSRSERVEDGRKPNGWDEDRVSNLLSLWLMFEKEILSVGSVDMLGISWPLSHFLAYTAIEGLRHSKRTLMNNISTKMNRNGKKSRHGEGRETAKAKKRAEWEEAYHEWVQRLKWQDEDDEEMEEVLARGRTGWWTKLKQLGVSNILRAMQKSEAEGQKVNLSFALKGEHTRDKENDTETTNPPPSPYSLPFFPDAASSTDKTDGYNMDNSNKPFPTIPSLGFPIPIRTLSTAPLLTYLSFLTHLVLFATEKSPDAITEHINRLSDKTSSRRNLSLGKKLKNVGMMLGMEQDDVDELVELLGGSGEDEEEEGGGGTAAFRALSVLVNGRREEGRAGVQEWLRRYERGGGFVVPRRMELLGHLDARNTERKERQKEVRL